MWGLIIIIMVWVFNADLRYLVKSDPLMKKKPGNNFHKSIKREPFVNATDESNKETFNDVSLPTYPYCDLCGENGLWTVRDRDGLKVFSNVNDSPFSLYTGSSSSSAAAAAALLPSWCRDVVIVQADSRNPSNEAMNENLKYILQE